MSGGGYETARDAHALYTLLNVHTREAIVLFDFYCCEDNRPQDIHNTRPPAVDRWETFKPPNQNKRENERSTFEIRLLGRACAPCIMVEEIEYAGNSNRYVYMTCLSKVFIELLVKSCKLFIYYVVDFLICY